MNKMTLHDNQYDPESFQIFIDTADSKDYHVNLYGLYDIEIVSLQVSTISLGIFYQLESTQLFNNISTQRYLIQPISAIYANNVRGIIFRNIHLNGLLNFHVIRLDTGVTLDNYLGGIIQLKCTRIA